jgi:hypothetical protein
MSLLNGLTLTAGKLRDLSVGAAQLDSIASTLRYSPNALEADAVDIVPRVGSASVEARLLERARAEMDVAERQAMEATQRHSTRASVRDEVGGPAVDPAAEGQAQARAAAAVKLWEERSDRHRAAVKLAESQCDKELAEVKAQCQVAFPLQVLERLLPGARSVGLQSLADGSVVTPGEVRAAVLRALHAQPTVRIVDAFAMYAKIFAPLLHLVSPRAIDIWGTLLTQLKAVHRDVGAQVALLTPPIVGRAIVEHVQEAVGTLGGSGPSLADLLEVGVGDGKGPVPSLTFDDLFVLLMSDEVRIKVAWLANLPVDPRKVKAFKTAGGGDAGGVAVSVQLPGAKAAILAPSGSAQPVCYTWRNTGACPYGENCKFLHETK